MSTSFIQTMDNALKSTVFTKFQSYFGLTVQNTDCVFQPKVIAQRKIAEKRGAGTVEFISLWRNDGGLYDWERQNTPIARRGVSIIYEDSNTKSAIVTIKGVPVKLNYDIWFWSRDLDKIAKAVEAYHLWQHSTPQLILYYNGIYEMNMYLKFGSVTDETDYNIYDKGLFYVYRLPLTMDAWVLDLTSTKTVLEIILDVYYREGVSPTYTDTLLQEYIITTN